MHANASFGVHRILNNCINIDFKRVLCFAEKSLGRNTDMIGYLSAKFLIQTGIRCISDNETPYWTCQLDVS